MTIELILFIAIVALVSSFIGLWAFGRALKSHKQRIIELQNRLNYLEASMSYHDLVPLPWEMDDFEEIKTFKQEGNVVYLYKDTTKEGDTNG